MIANLAPDGSAHIAIRPMLGASNGRFQIPNVSGETANFTLAGTPAPASVTRISVVPSSSTCVAETCTVVPSGACRIALSIRFSKILRVRSGSAEIRSCDRCVWI